MKKTKLLLLACLLTLVGWNATAQRVIAYHQGTNNSKLQDWYWNYITDINYAFLQVDTDGSVYLDKNDPTKYQEGLFNAFLSTAKAKGKRVGISIGGADVNQAKNFKTNAATYDKARNLAKNVVTWAKAKGVNEIDIDWEPLNSETLSDAERGYPTTTEWENLAKAFRDEITANGQGLELSAAIFPYKWNNGFVTQNSYQYFDHFCLMVYDFGYPDYPHHSNMVPAADNVYGGKTVEEACVTYWSKKGLAKDKMVLGLPFYGRPNTWNYQKDNFDSPQSAYFRNYRDIANATTSQLDQSGTWMYNGQPTIKRKTKYAITNGLKGVMAWELTGDATDKTLSLLAAIDAEITAAGCPKPNLGENQNICTKTSITLDAKLSATDYTFTWYKDNVLQTGTGKTFDAKAPGVYKVVAKKNGTSCFQENIVTLESTYPEIDVKDVPLCGAGDAIDVDATIKGFEAMTYKWTGAGTASTAKISINKIGNYTVTVSDPAGHCASKTKTITATESNVAVKGDTVCASGDEVKLKILDPGTYSWWDAKTGGKQLGTLDSLYAKITQTTPFYVQKTGGAVQYTAGLAYTHAAPGDAYSGPGTGDYEYASTGFDDVRLYFTVQQDLTIDQATVHLDLGSGTAFNGTFKVCIYDGALKELECKEVFVNANGKNTIPLGFSLTPGNYYLGIPLAKQWGEYYATNPPFDYKTLGIDGVITLNNTVLKSANSFATGYTNRYPGFYDLKISTGKPCPRVEVFGVIDDKNKKCIKIDPVVTITAPANNYKMETSANVDLVATATDADGTVASVKFVIKDSKGALVKELVASQSGTTYKANLSGLALGTYTVNAVATDNQGLIGISASITITVAAPNKAPTISFAAPSDKDVFPFNSEVGFLVDINDPDGMADLVKVVYTIKNGTTVVKTIEATNINDNAYQSWIADQSGTLTVEAKVFDKAGATATATITITIQGNSNPIVTITSPKDASSFDLNSTINITATANDPDGTVSKVEYLIKYQGTDVKTVVGTGGTYVASFVADKAGDYTIIATATDNLGAKGTNFVTITIKAAKAEPTVTITAPANNAVVNQNSTVNLTATAIDNDGTISKVEYSIKFGGVEVNKVTGTGSNYAGSFVADKIGVYTIIATATDNDGLTGTNQITITVEKPNENPILTIVEPANTSIKLPNNVNFNVTATDNDGTIASVTISINSENLTVSKNGSSYTATWNTGSVSPGKYTATIVATDDKGAKTTETVEITILAVDQNLPPTIVIVKPTTTITILTTETADIQTTITDDGSVVSVTIDGKSVSGSGDSYNTTFSSTTAGTFNIEVVATDDKGASSKKTITIIVEKPNEAPNVVITAPTDGQTITVTKGNTTIPITATITDDGTIASVVIKVNNAIVSNTASGSTYSGNFTALAGGQYTATVTATDNKGAVTEKSVTFTVVDQINTDAVISEITTNPAVIRENTSATISVTATDEEGVQSVKMIVKDQNGVETIVSSSTSGTTTSGSWSTTTAGTYTIIVTVTDNKGNVTTKEKTITVLAANKKPVIVITAPTNGQSITVTNANKIIAITATITDDAKVKTVVVKVDGMTVGHNASGSTYTANYTATKGGSVTATITATDEEGLMTEESVTFTIVDQINTDATISEITTNPDVIRVDGNTSIIVTATDPEGVQSVTMTVKDQNGVVTNVSSSTSGTTTTGSWSTTTAGTYTITVTVTDNKGNVTTKEKTITVLEGNQSPVIVLNPITSNSTTNEIKNGDIINLSASVSDDGAISKIFYVIEVNNGTTTSITKPNTNAPNYNQTYTIASKGVYTIYAQVTDADGVTVKSEVQTFEVAADPNAIAEENAIKLNYTVFPNPAMDNATISFELEESAITNVTVYNAQGVEVMTVVNDDLAAGTHTFKINVNEVPAGLYFIQLTTGDTLAIQRLIVE